MTLNPLKWLAPKPAPAKALPPAAAKWTPSPNFASRAGSPIDTIVLHNTAGPLNPSIARFMDRGAEVSAHYMVDRDGATYQFVLDSMCAWHAGSRAMNQRSIGIEIVAHGEIKNKAGEVIVKAALGMDPAQEEALLNLMRLLMKGYAIGPDKIIPHRHVVATACPGFVWPTDEGFATWVASKFGTKG